MLVHSLRRGGAERVLLEIALGLQKRRHQVEVIAWLDVDEYQDACYSSIKRHYLLSKDKYLWIRSIPRSAVELRKLVRQFNPDVIEIHSPNVTWVAAYAWLRIPCIHVLHGYGSITRYGSLKDNLIRYLSHLVDWLLSCSHIAVTESMIPVASSYFKLNCSDYTVVSNGVDLTKYLFKEKQPDDAPIIIMIGTLSPNKGQVLGIRAFIILLKSIPDAKLLIVGDGVDRDRLHALVQNEGLTGKVNLLGTRDDVPEILTKIHILWQLSESEAMPMVVLEAMASGVPVIGFDVRGTRDAVVDKITGHLIPYAEVSDIANKTVELLKDVPMYRSFSIKGRDRVEQFYDNACMVGGHEKAMRIKIGNQA